MARHTRSANSRAQKKPGRSTLPSTHNTTFSPASSMFSVTTTSASSPSSEPCSVTATPRVRSQCSAISTQAGRRFHGQEAVAELVALQDYYRTWLNALPQNLEPSATAEALRANGCGFKRPCRGRRSALRYAKAPRPPAARAPQPRVTFLNDRNSDISIWWRQPTTGAGPFPCCLRLAYFPALRPGHPLNRRTGAASG